MYPCEGLIPYNNGKIKGLECDRLLGWLVDGTRTNS